MYCAVHLVLSAGPSAQGFLSAALVVSSFHVLEKLGGEDGVERVVRPPPCALSCCFESNVGAWEWQQIVRFRFFTTQAWPTRDVCEQVRILYGEGDRYGCWVDIPAPAIVWHALAPPDGTPAAVPAASAAPVPPQGATALQATAADAVAAAWAKLGEDAVPGEVDVREADVKGPDAGVNGTDEDAAGVEEGRGGSADAPEAGLPVEVAAQLAGGDPRTHSLAEQVSPRSACLPPKTAACPHMASIHTKDVVVHSGCSRALHRR